MIRGEKNPEIQRKGEFDLRSSPGAVNDTKRLNGYQKSPHLKIERDF